MTKSHWSNDVCCKPANAVDGQQISRRWERRGKTLPYMFQRECGPIDTLIWALFCFVLAVLHSLQDLSSLTRDRTWALRSGSMES